MKKVFLIISIFMLSLNIYAGSVKSLNLIPEINWSENISDSLKMYIDYESNLIYLNIETYNHKVYQFNSFKKSSVNDVVKFETLAFNNGEVIAVNMLFYKNGECYIIIKNFKSGGIVKYKLNS